MADQLRSDRTAREQARELLRCQLTARRFRSFLDVPSLEKRNCSRPPSTEGKGLSLILSISQKRVLRIEREGKVWKEVKMQKRKKRSVQKNTGKGSEEEPWIPY